MNLYDISIQVTAPVGPADSLVWFIQFRPVGRVVAYSASHALRLAQELGWRAPVASSLNTSLNLPLLDKAPLKLIHTAPHTQAAKPPSKTSTFRRTGRLQ
jgi:hypothetical protein